MDSTKNLACSRVFVVVGVVEVDIDESGTMTLRLFRKKQTMPCSPRVCPCDASKRILTQYDIVSLLDMIKTKISQAKSQKIQQQLQQN